MQVTVWDKSRGKTHMIHFLQSNSHLYKIVVKSQRAETQIFQKIERETILSLHSPVLSCLKPVPSLHCCHSFHFSAPSS